ncbi:MAG TPA: hypothetical protein VGK70_10115 [Thermoanaerobaculia bacterium]
MGLRKFFALAAIVLLPLACTDRSPTGPAPNAVSGVQTAGETAVVPARESAPRSLAPRQSANDGMIGTWGGQHVTITIGAASTILSYDCAHGTIDQPFVVDSNGSFDLVGTHVPEAPGPIRQGDPVVHPARYTGTVEGKTIAFTVTETDIGQTLGPFVLTFGVAGRIFKCL